MGICNNEEANTTGNGTHATGDTGPETLDTFMVLLAFIAAAFALVVAMFNIMKHLMNYTRPEFQKSLIRIIFIVPVYSASCLSLAFPDYSIVVESIRDCWEAVVIYEFLRLILAYCGGESACLTVIMKNPGSITHMFPLNWCFRPIRLDSRFMRLCKQLTLQFVFIKPVMAIVNIVMFSECMLDNSIYYVTQLIVYNVSYSLSLYGLLLFYFGTHHHPGLASRKPLTKFIGVKLIIFATYYQGLLVQLVPGFNKHYLEALNSFIFCFEMIFFALFYLWAFGWQEYVDDGGQNFGLGDDADFSAAMEGDYEIGGMMPPPPPSSTVPESKAKKLESNVKDAFNMVDVVGDAAENFNTKYQNHVRLDTTSKNEALDEHLMMDDEDEVGQNPFQTVSDQQQQFPRSYSPTHQNQHDKSSSAGGHTKNPFEQD